MTAQNPQPQPQPETNDHQMVVKLEPTELDMVYKLAKDKEEALRAIGLRFLATLESTKHYGAILAGEQQFLQSVSSKYNIPQQSYLQFSKDGTLTATMPAQVPMPAVQQPEAAPAPEETDGESAG